MSFGGQLGDTTITGTNGSDRIVDLYGNNKINSGAGNDDIRVGNGNNTISAGTGNDKVVTGNGNNIIDAGTGDDLVLTGSGSDRILGGDGRDRIDADGGNDTIDGGAGNDLIAAGAGNDNVLGGSGNDIIFGDGSLSVCGDYSYCCGNDHSSYWGWGSGWGWNWGCGPVVTYDDFLDGGSGSDKVYGERGNDVLSYTVAENRGAYDIYDGGTGVDTLRIVLTPAEAANPAIQADLARFRAFLLQNSNPGSDCGRSFEFKAFCLTVRDFEKLEVVITGNAGPTANNDTNAGDAVTEAGVTPGDPNAAGNVLANDTDPDAGDVLTVTGAQAGNAAGPISGGVGTTLTGTYGTLTVNASGGYSYVLNNADADTNALAQGQAAQDVFSYTISDASGATSTARITIAITGANDGPTANNDTNAGDAVTEAGVTPGDPNAAGNVLANDTDPDAGDVLTVTGAQKGSVAGPIFGGTGGTLFGDYGTLVINSDGTYTYVLNNTDPDTQALAASQTAQDVFSYTISDASGAKSTAKLTINITGANDAPVAGPVTSAGDAVIEEGSVQRIAFPDIQLSAIAAGNGGFRINGENAGDNAGHSVAAIGDINGDGFDDLFVGAIANSNAGGANAGAAYVVFGQAGGAAINLSGVAAGNGGFKIIGEAAADNAGYSVSTVGDVNGDGLADLLIGAYLNDSGGNNAGAAYLVFGKTDSTLVNLDDVAAGVGGFKIIGENAIDAAGLSVSGAGDVNGDGLADILVSASGNDAAGPNAGAGYVVFGKTGTGAVNLDNVALGAGGFKITGENNADGASIAVSELGDVNGDGLADVLVSGYRNDAGGLDAGAAYVVFGKTGGALVNLDTVALGTGGYKVTGKFAGDWTGFSLSSVGDLNGDGRADMVIGAPFNDEGGADSGAAYVVFGQSGTAAIDLDAVASGIGGFKIVGESAGDRAGYAVSRAGDINQDGLDDILVGAFLSDPNGANSGTSYVVFGKSDGTAVNLDNVTNGAGGFRVLGEQADDRAGLSLSAAGDVDGDGLLDFIVGAPNATAAPGAAYVVYGRAFVDPVAGDATASGNVLSSASDPDAGDTLSVSTTGNFTGTYGTLTLAANGAWNYLLDDSDADTQALTTGQTVQDVFSFTVQDSQGATSTSTLAIAINGADDVARGVTLNGGAGDQTLTGGALADSLRGGAGNDTLAGNAGADLFRFDRPTDGLDTITDFVSGTDKLVIDAFNFGGTTAAGGTATLVSATDLASASHAGPGGYFVFDNAGADAGTVYWDATGGSASDAVGLVKLNGVTALSASDFQFV